MTDKELIESIARLWVANGGDAEGIEFSWIPIRDAVKRIENEEAQREQG